MGLLDVRLAGMVAEQHEVVVANQNHPLEAPARGVRDAVEVEEVEPEAAFATTILPLDA